MFERITARGGFIALARELGVRPDWHEPDVQGVSARVRGEDFDNAGFWPERGASSAQDGYDAEMHVVLFTEREGYSSPVPRAAVNLATLCSWAATPVEQPEIHLVREPRQRVTIDEMEHVLDDQLMVHREYCYECCDDVLCEDGKTIRRALNAVTDLRDSDILG